MVRKYSDDFIQYDEKKGKTENRKITTYLVTRSLLYVAIFFFALFFIWYFIFISTHLFFEVDGQSMNPTLNASGTNTDAVYVDTSSSAELFDVVVISYNDGYIIKRLMAQAGDYISIFMTNGEFGFHRIASGTDTTNLTSEDTLLDESDGKNGYSINVGINWGCGSTVTEANGVSYEPNFYKTYFVDTTYTTIEVDGALYVQVPENCFFYLGDNRGGSKDARVNGFASVDDITGRVEIIMYDHNFGSRIWAVIEFYFKEIEIFFER